MIDKDCIFCLIAGGDIPSDTVYEDDEFRVILDLNPATRGHALILPKQHYADLFEIDEEVLAKLAVLAKKIAGAMKESLACDGINIIQNNGAAAGQSVRHFHLHIIPRYENDGQKMLWIPRESDPEVQKTLVEAIRAAL
ncbi:MAG: HIT family protein [Lachnospiraceae bacterium]|nr:HIT family protein [Lachnospiraceae bacterium]